MFGRKRVVGIEIDRYEIRAVELANKGKTNRLVHWGRTLLPAGAVKDGIIVDVDKVSKALSNLWTQGNFKNKNVIIGIYNQDVIVRFADIPMMPKDKLDKFMNFQAQDYLPISVENLVFDYSVLGERVEENRKSLMVLLVGAKKDMVDSYVRALRGARLEPLDILVSPLALMKLLNVEDGEKTVAMIDADYNISNIVISEMGIPKLARMVQSKIEGEDMLIWSQLLAADINTSIGYYLAQNNSKNIEKIVLSGKGANDTGLADNLWEMLNMPVEIIQPFNGIEVSSKILESIGDKSLDFALSTSLALKGLEVRD